MRIYRLKSKLRWDGVILPPHFEKHGAWHLLRGAARRDGWMSASTLSILWHAARHFRRGGRWRRSNYAPPLTTELRHLAGHLWHGRYHDTPLYKGRRLTTRQVFSWWWYEQRFPFGQCRSCDRNLTLDERNAFHNEDAYECDLVCFDCHDPTPYEPDPYGGNGAY